MDSCIFEFEAVDIRGETKKVLIKKKKKKNLYRMLQLYTQFVVELLVVFSQVTFFKVRILKWIRGLFTNFP